MGDIIEYTQPSSKQGNDAADLRDDPAWLQKNEEALREAERAAAGWLRPEAIGEREWSDAPLAPPCIVERYLYADVGTLIAAGGAGKTTLLLYEAIHIVLGMPLYGRRIERPGHVLVLTAEDERARLVARAREIAHMLDLAPDQIDRLREGLEISDLTGSGFRLTAVLDDVVITHPVVGELIEALRDSPPVLTIIDPMVSFGVGESRVNDAEQGLIVVARRIVREIGCGVRLIHHTGKVAARAKINDAYAGRGGSALADGCRMVAVLTSHDDTEDTAHGDSTTPPPGLLPGQYLRLSLPKLSYCRPQQPIWISRDGYQYDWVDQPAPVGRDTQRAGMADQVERYLIAEFRAGHYYTQRDLETSRDRIGISRDAIREAISVLRVEGRIIDAPLPPDRRHGRRTEFLRPTQCAVV